MAIHFFTLLKHFGWGEYLRRILFHCARGVWGQEASTPLSPKPPLLQRSRRTGMVQRWYFFRMCAAPNSGGTMFIFDYSAPRRQPFGWSPGGLVARTFTPFAPTWVGAPAAEYRSGLFRSNPARSARSAFAGLRLRRGICIVSASGRLVHWSIHARCAKTTPTPADCQPARGDNKPLRRRIHG